MSTKARICQVNDDGWRVTLPDGRERSFYRLHDLEQARKDAWQWATDETGVVSHEFVRTDIGAAVAGMRRGASWTRPAWDEWRGHVRLATDAERGQMTPFFVLEARTRDTSAPLFCNPWCPTPADLLACDWHEV